MSGWVVPQGQSRDGDNIGLGLQVCVGKRAAPGAFWHSLRTRPGLLTLTEVAVTPS